MLTQVFLLNICKTKNSQCLLPKGETLGNGLQVGKNVQVGPLARASSAYMNAYNVPNEPPFGFFLY